MVSEKGQNFNREIPMTKLCDMLGGKPDYATSSCQFLDEDIAFDRSVFESPPKYAIYYALQIFIGTALSFFGTFYGITLVPQWWYLNVIILIVASLSFIFSDWFREKDIIESIRRFVLLVPIFVISSILLATTIEFGTPFNLKYWNPLIFFTTDPVIATITALFAGSILNVFIVPKSEVVQILNQ